MEMENSKTLARRVFVNLGFLACFTTGVGLANWAFAQDNYPEKPIRFVVAFAPGGMTDIIGRTIGQKLSDRLGQSVIVDNRGGAGGDVGAKIVASAVPDGYTLLVTTAGIAIRAVAKEGAVDPLTQLTPVAFLASTPSIFAANRSAGGKNLMEYVRDMNDGRFTYGSPGAGTLEHLTSEYVFKAVPQLRATHVPFAGGMDAINAALGKHIDLVSTAMPAAAALIRQGDLRVLAVASHKRMMVLPDVPTLGEIGFPNLENVSWIALLAPAGLRPDVGRTLNSQVNEVLRQPDVRDRLAEFGFDLRLITQSEFAEYLKIEMAKWQQIVKTVGFSLN